MYLCNNVLSLNVQPYFPDAPGSCLNPFFDIPYDILLAATALNFCFIGSLIKRLNIYRSSGALGMKDVLLMLPIYRSSGAFRYFVIET
jgi:hypothetical protein